MKKLLGGLILVSLFWLGGGQAVLALSDGRPVAGCAPPFELHHVMDHDNHHHRHIGSDTDRNGDGYLCVMHISADKHLHIDNNVESEHGNRGMIDHAN